MTELHQYGRALLNEKQPKEAMVIFKLNYGKHPKEFTTLMGMMRGYAANGDFKNALKYARQAQAVSPGGGYKTFMDDAIKKLEQGKDIN